MLFVHYMLQSFLDCKCIVKGEMPGVCVSESHPIGIQKSTQNLISALPKLYLLFEFFFNKKRKN